jgi:transcriptional regulator with XRE-family HTH domain
MPAELPPTRGNYIRAWRKFRGLTAAQLSEMTGLQQSHISRLERGLAGYTQHSLETLASCLECTPADLLATDPDAPRRKSTPAMKARLTKSERH